MATVCLFYSYERVAGVVPEKHKKLIVHIEKMNERQKRKKREKHEQVWAPQIHVWPLHTISLLTWLLSSREVQVQKAHVSPNQGK